MAFIEKFARDDYKSKNGPIAAGWYDATVVESIVKPTKSGNGGKVLELTYTINGPTYVGALVKSWMNVTNPSAEAENIGRTQLADLCRACDRDIPADDQELLQLRLAIKIGIKEEAGSEPKNVVKQWDNLDRLDKVNSLGATENTTVKIAKSLFGGNTQTPNSTSKQSSGFPNTPWAKK